MLTLNENQPIKLAKQKLNVWVVDDSRLILRWLETLLKQKAPYCQTKLYSSPAELLQDLFNPKLNKDEIPDVIITDLEMPEIDGLTICRQVRAHYNAQDLPLIMLTSVDPKKAMVKGYGAGANYYISKTTDKTSGEQALLGILALYSRLCGQKHTRSA